MAQQQPKLKLTAVELSKCDGKDGRPMCVLLARCAYVCDDDCRRYLSLCGTIYDVSDNEEMYQPPSDYNLFLGHDCSYAFALDSLDREVR